MDDLTRQEQAQALGFASVEEMERHQQFLDEQAERGRRAHEVVCTTKEAAEHVVGLPCPRCSEGLGVVGGWTQCPSPDSSGTAYVIVKCDACGYSRSQREV